MKEIIKRGAFERTLKEFECPVCGCVFQSDEYSNNFLKTYNSEILTIEYEDFCPMCCQSVNKLEAVVYKNGV